MQGNIVTASRWLGAAIILASGIIVGGLYWVRPSADPTPAFPVAPGHPATLDADVLRSTTEAGPGVTACRATEGSERTLILDESTPASCLDSPSEDEVWEKVPKSKDGSPVLYATRRDNVRIQVEKIGEKVDPCKVYPLAGPCQLVHCHYKGTVYFDEHYHTDDPISINHRKARVEVVFIDKDHLRRCGGAEAPKAAP